MDTNLLLIEQDLKDPLSKDQLLYYFQKWMKGDETAKDIIIMHNIKLVIHLANRLANSKEEQSELKATGCIGLIKSVETFDITKNIEFSTYAARCIENEMLMFLRSQQKYENNFSLDQPIKINKDEQNDQTFKDLLIDEQHDVIGQYEQKEIYEMIRKIIDGYSDRTKKIAVLYFEFQYTEKDISEKLHISQGYVSRIIANIINQVGEELKSQGLIDKFQKRKSIHMKI